MIEEGSLVCWVRKINFLEIRLIHRKTLREYENITFLGLPDLYRVYCRHPRGDFERAARGLRNLI